MEEEEEEKEREKDPLWALEGLFRSGESPEWCLRDNPPRLEQIDENDRLTALSGGLRSVSPLLPSSLFHRKKRRERKGKERVLFKRGASNNTRRGETETRNKGRGSAQTCRGFPSSLL